MCVFFLVGLFIVKINFYTVTSYVLLFIVNSIAVHSFSSCCCPFLPFHFQFMLSSILLPFHVVVHSFTISCCRPFSYHFMLSSILLPFHVVIHFLTISFSVHVFIHSLSFSVQVLSFLLNFMEKFADMLFVTYTYLVFIFHAFSSVITKTCGWVDSLLPCYLIYICSYSKSSLAFLWLRYTVSNMITWLSRFWGASTGLALWEYLSLQPWCFFPVTAIHIH